MNEMKWNTKTKSIARADEGGGEAGGPLSCGGDN